MTGLLWILACRLDEPVPVETVVNQWWSLEEERINIFLEQPGGELGGTLWYDYFGPAVPLDDNYYGGEWWKKGENKFSLDYEGVTWSVKAYPSPTHPDCYDLELGFLAKDLACPYVEDED